MAPSYKGKKEVYGLVGDRKEGRKGGSEGEREGTGRVGREERGMKRERRTGHSQEERKGFRTCARVRQSMGHNGQMPASAQMSLDRR